MPSSKSFQGHLEKESLNLIEIARGVCMLIPPVWELENYIAVNPFLGFLKMPIEKAVPMIEKGLDAQVLPGRRSISSRPEPTPVASGAMRHLSKWFSTVVTAEDWASKPLYEKWREFAITDSKPESAGLKGWRTWMRTSPETAFEVVSSIDLHYSASRLEAKLYQLLGLQYGWACLLRRQTWGGPDENPQLVMELLAILLMIDQGIKVLGKDSHGLISEFGAESIEDIQSRLSELENAEERYLSELSRIILPPNSASDKTVRVQAVFCIDVRSERLRCQLEQFPKVETLGFAGFFGLPLEICEGDTLSPRCPALINPTTRLVGEAPKKSWSKNLVFGTSKFAFVELTGLSKAYTLLKGVLSQSADPKAEESTPIKFADEILLDQKVSAAAAILKSTGLEGRLANFVIFCGHTSSSQNNAQSAGLECGACGGHGGSVNARVAALWLNDPLVRESLRLRGTEIPAETVFIPAVHDTSTDEVRFLDPDLENAHRVDREIVKIFETASEATRKERAPSLGLSGTSKKDLLAAYKRRSADGSEVCQEWGLAGNASFIISRRQRTRRVNLGGRAFLHEYDEEQDADGTILAMILAAPMVVASWISWQYFASTVDNMRFGAGPKSLQNPIGSLGLIKGNAGDFCTGLSLESVHLKDGSWFHEPLRLQVIVEASPARIEAAIAASETVTQLTENSWIRIFSISREGNQLFRRNRGGEWQVQSTGCFPFESLTNKAESNPIHP